MSSIKEKLESRELSLDDYAPLIVEMTNGKVSVYTKAPNPDELASFLDDDSYFPEKIVFINKIKAKSYGEWDMYIQVISTKHLENRQTLDQLHYSEFQEYGEYEEFGTVSIRHAIYECGVEIGCDMDFYLEHPNEIEMELNRSVDVSLIKDDAEALKNLEEDLFYNQMCSLFGEDVDDDDEDVESNGEFKKVYTVKEFAILYKDGNDVYATGRRGDKYILFRYGTS